MSSKSKSTGAKKSCYEKQLKKDGTLIQNT